jgi:large subunit ribosomal protein L6
MSRIGKAPVIVPAGVEVKINKGIVTVKGPKGELSQDIDAALTVEFNDNQLVVKRHTEEKDHRAKHGLYRSLLSNMVEGVTQGYKLQQELVGVGYRATNQGQKLELLLGFSHGIVFELPTEVKVSCESVRGKSPIITLESHDKQLLGHVAAKIRSFRRPEPYKGKGIKYENEIIVRKEGKKK